MGLRDLEGLTLTPDVEGSAEDGAGEAVILCGFGTMEHPEQEKDRGVSDLSPSVSIWTTAARLLFELKYM